MIETKITSIFKKTKNIIKLAQLARFVQAAKLDRYMEIFKNFPNKKAIEDEIKKAIDVLKKEDRIVWYLKRYRESLQNNQPLSFFDELKHYMGMTETFPQMKDYKFDSNKEWNQIKADLDKIEEEVHKNLSAEDRIIKEEEQEGIKLFLDLPGDYAWWSLEKPSCSVEGRAMGHCGNNGSPNPGDNILSLRKTIKKGNKTYQEPVATFIYNNGYLGETKGRSNKKVIEKYHPYVVALLKDPRIKYNLGGGYAPESNITLSDFSEKEREEILKANPQMGVFPNIKDVPEHHKISIASNPNTPLKTLIELSKDENSEVRGAVASNPNTPLKTLIELSKDKDSEVRGAVASNPNTPQEILAYLSKDKDSEVRSTVIRNPQVSQEILAYLSKDEDLHVRKDVFLNSKTPIGVLIEFITKDSKTEDEDDYLTPIVLRNPKIPQEILIQFSSGSINAKIGIASNPSTPLKILRELAKSEWLIVLDSVSSNPITPPEILTELFNRIQRNLKKEEEDNTDWIKSLRKIAGNPNTPPEILTKLSNPLNDEEILDKIAANPSTPLDVLINLEPTNRYKAYVHRNPTWIKYIKQKKVASNINKLRRDLVAFRSKL